MPASPTQDTVIVPLLGDQLTHSIASLRNADPDNAIILMAEVAEETSYIRHHKKKIALVLSAMRHFADELEAAGRRVRYTRLDDPANTGSLTGEIERAVNDVSATRVVVVEPGEWRLAEALRTLRDSLDVPLDIVEDDRFIVSHRRFADWAEDRKELRMEYFYREIRRETGLLIEDGKPTGGRWNFDAENRKPGSDDIGETEPLGFEPDAITDDVLSLVEDRFGGHPGTLRPFRFAVTADQAALALDHFIEHALPRFGDYQDAMLLDRRFLHHSVLSPYINLGLLDPLTVCRRVEAAYEAGAAPINAAEGFIRQIIGWREYVRGVYWRFMPDYAEYNKLNATRDLPDFYWSGATDMACLRAVIEQTMAEAYAHHIQRLMVTGTFALLAGIDPRQVHEWYLAVYADAYEWVEMPNTLGMSQFADGGLLASKPYAASGNYINRMSDYCGDCAYKVKEKTGEAACPFNYLYWDFLARNRDALGRNPRLGQPYRTYDRFGDERKKKIAADARRFLDGLG